MVRYRICDLALGAALKLAEKPLGEVFPYFAAEHGPGLDVRSVIVDVDDEKLSERREVDCEVASRTEQTGDASLEGLVAAFLSELDLSRAGRIDPVSWWREIASLCRVLISAATTIWDWLVTLW